MEDCYPVDQLVSTHQQNDRLTIGYLAFLISDDLGRAWWSGVADTARKQGANVICFRGGPLHDPMDPSTEPTAVYELVSRERVNGWVIGNIVADTPASVARLRDLLDRRLGRAVVSLRKLLPDVPYVSMDNYRGVQEAVDHLIEVHGYRRIAFLRGPQAHPYAQERYRAYMDALQTHGLPLDPNLVAPPHDWSGSPIRVLLEERKLKPSVDFDAVVAANDLMALDAMSRLTAQGARIPQDVAVIGFNNNPSSSVALPPLTTVAMPFQVQGQRTVEMLLMLLAGNSLQEQVALPARLVIRRSCGCQWPLVMQAAAGAITEVREFRELDGAREQILAGVAQAAGSDSVMDWARQLLEGLIVELSGGTPGTFIREMDHTMPPIIASGDDLSVWQKALSALRRLTLPYMGKMLAQVEALWQQARVMLSAAVQQVQTSETLQAQRQTQIVRRIGHALGSAFDMNQLMDTVARELPHLSIPSCYISLYEDPQTPAAWSRLIMAYNEEGRVELEPGGVRFKSCELLPDNLWPRDKQFCLVVEPLYFQKNQLGFATFEVGPQNGAIYEMLGTQISSALQGALLVRRIQERSAELTRQQYVLNTFMENVPDRIYFKDLNSRITRANKAHATRHGFGSPAEEIGKSDADFYPPEEARHRHEQEQQIIQSGQSLSIEEKNVWPNGHVDWSQTIKMPLRDERDNIIGTFGISHDITALKQIEESLAYEQYLFNTIMDNAPYAIWFKDAAGRFIRVNRAWASRHGLDDPAMAVGKTDSDFTLAEIAQGILRDEQAILETGQPLVDKEARGVLADGQTVWVLTTKMPLYDKDGNIVGTFGISRDITPLKQAQAALEKAYAEVERQVAERTAELQQDVTLRKRAEEEIRRLNQALERRARGLAALNKAGRLVASTLDLDTLLRLVMEQIEGLLDVEAASLTLREPGSAGEELVFVAATGPGSERLVGVRMPATVGIAGWVMRETLPALVSDVRSDPRFYDRIDAVTGMTVHSLLAVPLVFQDKVLGVVEAVNKLPVDGQSAFDQDDLEMLEALAGSAAIAIQNARLYRAEREAFRRLQESQTQLVQAEKMGALGRLVASITHEINNPLQAIQNSLELAEEELEGSVRREKLARYLGMARTEIERLASILRRLRDFYRPVRQEMQPTDIHAVLRSVLDLTGKQLQHANIAVELGQAFDLPQVLATPDHLKQVFLNLILNAIDAMSDEGRSGGTLSVRTALDQMQMADDCWVAAVCIELSDTGNGIPPGILPRIFEPFVTTKGTGTGLGLSISYGIIEAHGGRITVASEVGVGTTFTVLLPAIET
jgi:PAS domain S-box-containing protein